MLRSLRREFVRKELSGVRQRQPYEDEEHGFGRSTVLAA
jgi:hypothetical protein